MLLKKYTFPVLFEDFARDLVSYLKLPEHEHLHTDTTINTIEQSYSKLFGTPLAWDDCINFLNVILAMTREEKQSKVIVSPTKKTSLSPKKQKEFYEEALKHHESILENQQQEISRLTEEIVKQKKEISTQKQQIELLEDINSTIEAQLDLAQKDVELWKSRSRIREEKVVNRVNVACQALVRQSEDISIQTDLEPPKENENFDFDNYFEKSETPKKEVELPAETEKNSITQEIVISESVREQLEIRDRCNFYSYLCNRYRIAEINVRNENKD
ncbi:hypothetical protein O9G_000301 [Rozella allomycis CSF55]|uniref:Uncharacterized protein n=1 Tax=Rozella allomycis (strain CSF55) TaxID=988480 RepID=A0A075ATF9_ROZAC|nr:hypothetical protein O9G_000301 [Rozella allomycis CSF55]|eukprot:EPZ31822.1 hypothetical protein O9G_000301 [Rozella allomycis CSF55]